jgi:hypothetical protein
MPSAVSRQPLLDELANYRSSAVRGRSSRRRDAEGNRTPDWPGCSRSPLPLGYGIIRNKRWTRRDSNSRSSRCRRDAFPLSYRPMYILLVRGAESNRRSPGSRSGALSPKLPRTWVMIDLFRVKESNPDWPVQSRPSYHWTNTEWSERAHPERFKLPTCRVVAGCSCSLSYGCRRLIVAEEGVEPSAWLLWATRSGPLSYTARLKFRRRVGYLQNGAYKGTALSASLRAL